MGVATIEQRDSRSQFGYYEHIMKLEIRSVEHGICPIAEFTSPLLSCAAILAIRS